MKTTSRHSQQNAIVVGAGVIGLTTAIRMQERGWRVGIVAAECSPKTTSDVAGAIWFPYRAEPRERVMHWSRTTRDIYENHPRGRPGVSNVLLHDLQAARYDSTRQPWWRPAVSDVRVVEGSAVPPEYGHALEVRVPVVDVPTYMPYLAQRFQELGGTFRKTPQVVRTLSDLDAAVVINCSGLGARELCQDESVYPIRGQIVRVSNPGIEVAYADDEGPNSLAYIIPRPSDVILGGTATDNDYSLRPNDDTTRAIVERCCRIVPKLKNAIVLDVRVGLRPGRTTVRLERDPTLENVIHNYGHGGSGFTICWGCAAEVADLADSLDDGSRKLHREGEGRAV